MQPVDEQGHNDAGHGLRGGIQQELRHRHHLLPEGCPAPFLQKNPAPFKPPPENPPKTPPAGRKPAFRPALLPVAAFRAAHVFMNIHEHVCAPAAFPASAPTPASVAVPFPPCAAASSPKLSGRRTGSCFVFLIFQQVMIFPCPTRRTVRRIPPAPEDLPGGVVPRAPVEQAS